MPAENGPHTKLGTGQIVTLKYSMTYPMACKARTHSSLTASGTQFFIVMNLFTTDEKNSRTVN
ncbi:hypothetical protein ADT36_09850 [Yersinia pestis subsp. microtus bv. Caucasica]|nr:hypothetical protein ADT36_09850 [Yersinia pestis subsp. microtus bv. Caucasica]